MNFRRLGEEEVGIAVDETTNSRDLEEILTVLADAPTAEAIDTINVRSGPGVDYPSYGLAKKGDKALILGVSADGAWWVIELPTYVAPDGRGWVSAEYVTATNADNVAVIEAPPLP